MGGQRSNQACTENKPRQTEATWFYPCKDRCVKEADMAVSTLDASQSGWQLLCGTQPCPDSCGLCTGRSTSIFRGTAKWPKLLPLGCKDVHISPSCRKGHSGQLAHLWGSARQLQHRCCAGAPWGDRAWLWAHLLGGEHRTDVGSWRAGLGWQKVVCNGKGSRKGPESGGCLGSSSRNESLHRSLVVVLNSPKPGLVPSKVFLATLSIQRTQICDTSRFLFPVGDLLWPSLSGPGLRRWRLLNTMSAVSEVVFV